MNTSEIVDIINECLDIADIPNHSFNDAGLALGDWIRINDCQDGSVAFNNCVAVSDWIVEYVFRGNQIDVSYCCVYLDNGNCHAALQAPNGDIIDYTIRQFDKTLAFPWIGTLTDWLAIVQSSTDNQDTKIDNLVIN